MKINKQGLIAFAIFFSMSLSYSAQAQTVDNQGYRWWRGQSSDLEQKINALDTTPVASVYIPILFGVGGFCFFIAHSSALGFDVLCCLNQINIGY